MVDAWRRFALRIRNADRYCSTIYRRGGFILFHPLTFWLVVAIATVALAAAYQLAAHSIEFARLLSARPYLSTGVILITLLAASMLHVLVHALACKAHGRRVREMGFFLLQGVLPTFYADVTDIFMSNRRARLMVDLAGPMVEVFFGSLAMLTAYLSAPGIEQALLFGVGVLLWESALINLYPFSFLELDGYNILADLLAMPMLRKQALALIPNLAQSLRNIRDDPASGNNPDRIPDPVSASPCLFISFCISMRSARCFHWHGARRSPAARPTAASSLFSAQLPQPLLPAIALAFELLDRHAFFNVPALETVLFGGAAVLIAFQNFLAVRTEQKIDEQNRRMGMRRIGR